MAGSVTGSHPIAARHGAVHRDDFDRVRDDRDVTDYVCVAK